MLARITAKSCGACSTVVGKLTNQVRQVLLPLPPRLTISICMQEEMKMFDHHHIASSRPA
jgi:hypothetical protein